MESVVTHPLHGQRVVITGANGWLGRELIARLECLGPDVEVLAITRQVLDPSFRKRQGVTSYTWDLDFTRNWQPTTFVHLAAVTKEYFHHANHDQLLEINSGLTQSALEIAELDSVERVVLASSGAAVMQLDHPYGIHKAREEAAFKESCDTNGKNLIVSRIWSVSGKHCTKRNLLLFFDLIDQAQGPSEAIVIASRKKVLRRYVDGGEFLELCLRVACASRSATIDSEGELIEAYDLANLIQRSLGTSKVIVRPANNMGRDAYFSKSNTLHEWEKLAGMYMSNLRTQIEISAAFRTDNRK